MSGYGRDESAPTPDGMFRGGGGMFATYFVAVSCIFTVSSLHFGRPSAMFWQSVSSRRGPIYRARKYECTHEMGNGNAYSMK